MVAGTLLDRVVSMGESPTKRDFNSRYISKTGVPNNDGHVDSIIHLLFSDIFLPSHVHMNIIMLVHHLTNVL